MKTTALTAFLLLSVAACGVETPTGDETLASREQEIRLPPPPTTSLYCPQYWREVDAAFGSPSSFHGVGCAYQRMLGATFGTVLTANIEFPVFVASQCSASNAVITMSGRGDITKVATFVNGVCTIQFNCKVTSGGATTSVLITANDTNARVTLNQRLLSSDAEARAESRRCALADVI